MPAQKQDISLKMFAENRFIALIQNVVEQTSLAFGLERNAALKLTMGAEELISYLAKIAKGAEVNLTISDKGWCVVADFSFIADPSELWAMNLVSKVDVACSEDMECLGLLLVARMSNDFSVQLDGKNVHLILRQDRHYPTIEPKPSVKSLSKGKITKVENPEPALIKEACTQVLNLYPPHLVHEALNRPGKVVDMVAQNDLEVITTVDETGILTGLILLSSPSDQSVSFSGPYVFVENSNTAEILETQMFNNVARTSAVSLFSELATEDLGTHNFEKLGQINFIQPGKSATLLNSWYRSLHEDNGDKVWTHPSMHNFLKDVYDDLFLMRTIHETDVSGESLPERSVFSARLRPELKEASLSPQVVGKDSGKLVAGYVCSLKNDGYLNIFFTLDLAYGWQAEMGGVLAENNFEPKLILPHAGKSDMVIFQHV